MKNRWTIAASAVGIHISIGSVYAWSVMSKPLSAAYGWTPGQVSLTFSIAIFCLGLSAAFLGRFVQVRGPRVAGSVAAVLFGTGLLLAGAGCKSEQLWLLYLGYGVFGGIGIGFGYITPIATLMQWFPERRGLATGIAIMGFGFAALICGPVSQVLMERWGVPTMFGVLGVCYFVLIFVSAQHLSSPASTQTVNTSGIAQAGWTIRQAVGSVRFYLL